MSGKPVLPDDELRPAVIAALRDLSPDGVLCTQRTWDERKPADQPSSARLLRHLDLVSWYDLAEMADLQVDDNPQRLGRPTETVALSMRRGRRDPRSIVTATAQQPGIALVREFIGRWQRW